MTAAIEISNEAEYPVDQQRLESAIRAVLAAYTDAPSDSSLTVVFTDNDAVAALNRQFREIDAPTDVLSFPADPPPVEIPDEPVYLGDLVIAFPYASAQASREGHDLQDSLALLVIHGTLHLLGYDHDTVENRAEMWKAQENALRELGISPEIVPALEGNRS
jgi:probable rRNA maturation factor